MKFELSMFGEIVEYRLISSSDFANRFDENFIDKKIE